MLSKLRHLFKTLYQRAFIMGTAIPPDQGWRAYLPMVSSCLILVLFLALLLTDPNIERWRAMLSWSLIGASLLGLFLGVGWIHGHHCRDNMPPDVLASQDIGSGNTMKIALAAALTAPPLARHILGLFGREP